MPQWVCLLRAVNLGSHNKVNMPKLREVLTASGFGDVRTYVQSGNVVVTTDRAADKVSAAVRSVLRDDFGVDVPVVVPSPGQLRAVLDWCPFPDAVDRPTSVHVIHLAATPAADRVDKALAEDWSPDELAIRGQEAVTRYAEAMHKSRLQHATVLRRLGVDGTARNWRTLTALVDLTAG